MAWLTFLSARLSWNLCLKLFCSLEHAQVSSEIVAAAINSTEYFGGEQWLMTKICICTNAEWASALFCP